MPVLVTSNVDDNSIKNEWASMETPFSHYKSKMSGLIQPKTELDQVFMYVLVSSNFDDDSIKNDRASMETPFSHYKYMGIFLDAQWQLTP